MKYVLTIIALCGLGNNAFPGSCHIDHNTVSGNNFVIKNSLRQSITLDLFRSGRLTPVSSSSLSSGASMQSSNKDIIQVCAYTKSSISSHVSQTNKLACCKTSKSFAGSTVTFTGNTSRRNGQYELPSNTELAGRSLGNVMGY